MGRTRWRVAPLYFVRGYNVEDLSDYGDCDEGREGYDPRISIYDDIAADLFKRYPDARWGPGHVVLEDGNWDAYEDAITLTLFVLATRSLRALGVDDMIDEQPFLFYRFMPAVLIADRADYYADHSIAELGATLAALELIRWHEEGHQGDPPT